MQNFVSRFLPAVRRLDVGSSTRRLSTIISPTSSRAVSNVAKHNPDVTSTDEKVDANILVAKDLDKMFLEIHSELESEIRQDIELTEMSKYYFDGHGKAIRPVIAMTLGHAVNSHFNISNKEDVISKQRKVAIISEMIHTASLVHDDVLDHAETRRGKPAINRKWDITRSAMCGDYILAVASKVLAQIRNEDVLIVLAQVLADLVRGEFQQLQNKSDDAERFQLYLNKTFNKTASLMAYSCKANGLLSAAGGGYDKNHLLVEASFQYGRNIGIAFQLVDDMLDFVSSSEQLGKPAAADLHLGLATAPVLFACAKYPELEKMIARRFSQPGDVQMAFEAALNSDGLDRTRSLARTHCEKALESIEPLAHSKYKLALASLTETVLTRMK